MVKKVHKGYKKEECAMEELACIIKVRVCYILLEC